MSEQLSVMEMPSVEQVADGGEIAARAEAFLRSMGGAATSEMRGGPEDDEGADGTIEESGSESYGVLPGLIGDGSVEPIRAGDPDELKIDVSEEELRELIGNDPDRDLPPGSGRCEDVQPIGGGTVHEIIAGPPDEVEDDLDDDHDEVSDRGLL